MFLKVITNKSLINFVNRLNKLQNKKIKKIIKLNKICCITKKGMVIFYLLEANADLAQSGRATDL